VVAPYDLYFSSSPRKYLFSKLKKPRKSFEKTKFKPFNSLFILFKSSSSLGSAHGCFSPDANIP
jgi:hypothetical protein